MPINAVVYQPQAQVTLYKTIARTTTNGTTLVSDRFSGTVAARTIDLTPFLGEGSAMRTSKGLRDPAGGFSLALLDRGYESPARPGTFESLYGIIEPMDLIEIRLQHGPPTATQKAMSSYTPSKLNIVMRGFVSRVGRSESMGPDGRPQRLVTVSGQDYGKLWQMIQILYFPRLITGENLLSSFKFSEAFGVAAVTSQTAAAFAAMIINSVLNPFLAALLPPNSGFPQTITPAISVQYGSVSVLGPQSQEGTIFALMRTYLDVGAWNELYFEDREDGVYLVYRPNPYMDVSTGTDSLIQPDATTPDVIDVTENDLISLEVSRSDADVANFFWVNAPRFDLATDLYRKLWALSEADLANTVLFDTYLNSATQLYGTRVMYAETQMGGGETPTANSGLNQAGETARLQDVAGWANNRRGILATQNKDNVLLERGSMRLRGNEFIRPGIYVRLHRGSFVAQYYVVAVSHDFAPMVGFFTTVEFDRGTGFIQRVLSDGGSNSPYLAEMRNING